MTTLLDCLNALAARPAPLPEPLAFIAHPAWAEDENMLAVLRGMQARGMDVRVQADIRLPSVSLDCWLDRKRVPVCVVCGAWAGVRLGRGDQKWRCPSAECT